MNGCQRCKTILYLTLIKPNLDSIVRNFSKEPKKFINGDHSNHEIHDWRMSTYSAITDVFAPKSRSLRQVNTKYGGALNRKKGKLGRGRDGCADLWACFVEEEIGFAFFLLHSLSLSFPFIHSLSSFDSLSSLPLILSLPFLWFSSLLTLPFRSLLINCEVSCHYFLLWKIGLEFCSNKLSNHHGYNPSH